LRVDINGTQAYKDIQDFNGSPFFYASTTETNPWRSGFSSPGASGTWFGNTVQSNGSLQISPTVTEVGSVFDLGNTSSPIDMRGMQALQVVAKKLSGANTDNFAIVFGDIDGTAYAYRFPTAPLNSSTYTTLNLNILSPSVDVQDCLSGMNMAAISAWEVVSDLGDSNMNGSDSFGLQIDRIGMVSPLANSLVKANGTVSLNGATLNVSLNNNFAPTISQTFTLIDNDGTDAVSGTFAGLSEGANVTLGGLKFTISYTGGTGNDVTLTRIVSPPPVAVTHLFYKGSTKWDVTNGATFSDDNAIAPDKTAYLPGGGTSSFSAVSSFDKGINGLMVDFGGTHGVITANDFIFKVGNNNSPSLWATATAPTTVTMRAGGGTSGRDRVELMWADNAIQKQWLEVIVKGNDTLGGSDANTGLASSYVFYWGSAVGDAGVADSGAFQVTSADEINARNNPKTISNPATRSDVNDFNRNGLVDSSDQIIARNNTTSIVNQLKFLVVGAGGPFAPESSTALADAAPTVATSDNETASAETNSNGDRGMASALAASSSGGGGSSSASGPPWISLRLESVAPPSSSSSGQLLSDEDSPAGGSLKRSANDELLGELVDGLS
jgi:hypothetical protein